MKISKAFEGLGVVAREFKGFFGVFYRFDLYNSNKKSKPKFQKYRLRNRFEYSPKISEKTAMFQDQQPLIMLIQHKRCPTVAIKILGLKLNS